jgi:hypothetical protein
LRRLSEPFFIKCELGITFCTPMIDTVTMWLETKDALGVKFLGDAREQVSLETGEVSVFGNYKNLRVHCNASGISLKGSLSKYELGDNLQRLTRGKVQMAIERLCDETLLNWKRARVFRLDVGTCLVVKQPCSTYFKGLGELPRYQRSEQGENGLLYTTSTKALSFYDKIKEVRRKQERLPSAFEGLNVLRYELQFRNRLKDVFKVPEILAETLYNETFYIKALTMWKNVYFSIHKQGKLKFNPEMLVGLNVKKLESSLAAIALRELGEREVLAMIQAARKGGLLTKIQAKRLKAKVRELATLPAIIEPSEAMLELDSKVKQSVQFFR